MGDKPVVALAVRSPTTTAVHPTPAAQPPTVAASAPTVTAETPPSATPTASSAATPDDKFISWLAADGMTPDDRAITLHNAHAVCGAFQEGGPRSEIVRVTRLNTGLPEFATVDFISIAVNTFCPQYGGRLVQ
jgi:hypothetical protein